MNSISFNEFEIYLNVQKLYFFFELIKKNNKKLRDDFR